jgi:hypothetical protein
MCTADQLDDFYYLCTSCPADSQSVAGSTVSTSCKCNAGFSGPDGGSCTACGAGKYKDTIGSTLCTSCPAGSSSPAGSITQGNCVCMAGFKGLNGGPCTKCPPGEYSAAGAASCLTCPVNMWSYAGAQDCYCNVGYYAPVEGVLGPTFNDFVCQGSWSGIYTFHSVIGSRPVYSKSASQFFMLTDYGYYNFIWEARDGIDSGYAYLGSQSVVYTQDFSVFYPSLYPLSEWCGAWIYSTARWRAYHTSVCQACPADSTNSYHGSSNCLCNAGYEGTVSGTCAACGAGKYKTDTGNGVCSNCPPNTDHVLIAQTLDSACQCNAGTFPRLIASPHALTCLDMP